MRFAVTLVAALAAAPLAALAQENFYVDFAAGDADTSTEQVTGEITLASGTQGAVSDNQVLGYTLSSTPGDPVAFSIQGQGAGGMGPSLFTVQGHDLLFTPLPFEPSPPCYTCDHNALQEATFGNPSAGAMYFAGPGFDGYPGDHGGDGHIGEPGGMSVAGYPIDGSTIGEGNWPIPTGTVLATATAAPEISANGAACALTLLLGLLAMASHRSREAVPQVP
jgi:hypothetical protein